MPVGTQSLVYVVVLNWNQCALTLACLESLLAVDFPQDLLNVLLVDNASTDGTPEQVRERFPAVAVVQNQHNLGYAGGNNVGIRIALEKGAQFVCLLNNDVTVTPGFLLPLLIELQQHGDVGAVTPLVMEQSGSEPVGVLGSLVDRRTAEVHHVRGAEAATAASSGQPATVDAVHGAAMLARRDAFERAGLLDEAYYLYYEETDWCLRVQEAGYRIVAVPASVVWHRGSATLGSTSLALEYYMNRNQLRFIARHWSGMRGLLILGCAVLRQALTIAAYSVKPHGGQRVPCRNARLRALRDAILGRWGPMGSDGIAVAGEVR